MKIEARLFEFIAAFFVLSAVLYGILTALFATGGVEWAGTTALALTGGLAVITGSFFWFISRRLDTRPEDYEGAEISDGAGELGFFAPHSWWPILVALAGSVAAVGIALWLPCPTASPAREAPRLHWCARAWEFLIVPGQTLPNGIEQRSRGKGARIK
ncbi:cytochrome c oxidase subunit 4 [Mycobacterium sp. E796]|uniref:cytochrome c oxidase subunit 4 n=1 Tax=Mycobacterium sp. E796 TaxID=1834151 RepID=UPI0009EE8451